MEDIQMAMESTTLHKVSIQQVVSTHPIPSTVLTLTELLQVLIQAKAVPQSRAVDRLDSNTLSTSIITIPVHTVKG